MPAHETEHAGDSNETLGQPVCRRLAAGLEAACSGGDGADEAAVAQPAQFQPGERLAMKTLLLAGSSQTRCCVVHGVTLMARGKGQWRWVSLILSLW